MSNSGSRLYLTCRIFRPTASCNPPPFKIPLLGLRRPCLNESHTPATFRCICGAKVIPSSSKFFLANQQARLGPRLRRKFLRDRIPVGPNHFSLTGQNRPAPPGAPGDTRRQEQLL